MNAHSLQLSLEELTIELSLEPVSSLTHKRLMELTNRLPLPDELTSRLLVPAAGRPAGPARSNCSQKNACGPAAGPASTEGRRLAPLEAHDVTFHPRAGYERP